MESYKTINGNLNMVDNEVKDVEAVRQYVNETLEENASKFLKEKVLDKSKDIVEKQGSLEIMPNTTYVLVKPYEVNPYQKIEVSEGGITMNSLDKGHYISQDTGEEEQAEMWSRVGQVIEVGPQCKYIKPGDDIMYRKPSAIPILFFNLGMEVVAENSVQVIINERLKERLSNC